MMLLCRPPRLLGAASGGAARRGRRLRSAKSYDSYLRLLQTQVVKDGALLLEGKEAEEKGLAAPAEKTKFVSYNQLASTPDAPRDPLLLFRDIDNLRALAQAAGSSLSLSDTDCSTLCLDLMEEVKRGRRLTKDIVEVFDKMEAHPDFYKVRGKAYNVMIFNTAAREYPAMETPARLYGSLLEKEGGKAPFWTYVCMSRVQLFIPPIDRKDYQDSFIAEVDSLEDAGAITVHDAARARTLIRNLRYITDAARLLLYSVGLAATAFALWHVSEARRVGRLEREVRETEFFRELDTQYYGDSMITDSKAATAVRAGRAGIVGGSDPTAEE